MSRALTHSPTWLHRKRCLSCGFDGRELQSPKEERTFSCPSCGCDLYARPPRSYADLEGLVSMDEQEVSLLSVATEDPGAASASRWRRLAPRFESLVVWSLGLLILGVVAAGVVQDLLARL